MGIDIIKIIMKFAPLIALLALARAAEPGDEELGEDDPPEGGEDELVECLSGDDCTDNMLCPVPTIVWGDDVDQDFKDAYNEADTEPTVCLPSDECANLVAYMEGMDYAEIDGVDGITIDCQEASAAS